MKKTILQIILCFFLSATNLIIDGIPIGKIYLKYYICSLDAAEYIGKINKADFLSFLDEKEKLELNQLIEFQNQYCNH